MEPVISEIFNEDGTNMDLFPFNPLREKWNSLYPPTRNDNPCGPILGYEKSGAPIMNYTCIFCHEMKCPHSPYWVVPDEDIDIWEKYQNDIKKYHEKHNPRIFNIIMENLKTESRK